ncbi:TonB-dependent receptor plug domain-containing protein [Hymenobacter sp. UYP22]|uniref:TonB-dependent receptor n=1 Tax=Hymenobacter sp. UYP22 TaxID=3156348 RepID=UPI0033918C16
MCSPAWAQTGPGSWQITGTVRAAETRQPLPGAVLELVELGVRTTAADAGQYRFRLPASGARQFTLRVTYVGRQDVEVLVKLTATPEIRRDLQLPLRSLELADVQVNATRSGQQTSNSAVVIGREAIEQTQAYSLDDVLQLLPGKVLLNTNLQGAQAITLRQAPVTTPGSDQTAFNLNNAFGTAIIVDGAAWSNNGNLQTDDPGRRGGIGGVAVTRDNSGNEYSTGTYAGSSVDLKQIPANNIESVEVIQGVPSARYGDLTSGAVIVNRQAGRTPYRLSLRTQNGTTELSGSRGFGLTSGNAVNVSATLLNSNPEPQFETKRFNRATLSTIFTSHFGPQRRHRNSLALDAHTTLDAAKADADDPAANRTFSRDQRVALSNRGTLNVLQPWSEYISYQFGGSYAYQQTFSRTALNVGVKPVADGLSTGIYDGTFAPPVYDSERTISGRPVNLYARADNTVLFQTGAFSHTLTAGASLSYDRNYGAGRLFDALRPRFAPLEGKAERPFDFRTLPGMLQVGGFVENQLVREWGARRLVANLGLRYDQQNGFASLAPRLNAKLFVREGLQVNAAYGLATKAPGLVHRYPGILYFDVPLLVSYNGRVDESIYRLHTEALDPANPNLRPARATTLETGLNWHTRRGYGLALTVYHKQERDGFSVTDELLQLQLPHYRIVSSPAGRPPVVEQTGQTRNYNYDYGVFRNTLRTDNYGLELLARTPKIRSIQTSFDLSAAYTRSRYGYAGQLVYDRVNPTAAGFENIEFVVKNRPDRRASSVLSTLAATTHLPRLGLLLTWRGQVFLQSESQTLDEYVAASGFVRPSGEYVPVTAEDYAAGRYLHLRNAQNTNVSSQPFIYGNLHLRLGKELGKLARLSFFANNVLNLRTERVEVFAAGSTVTRGGATYTSPHGPLIISTSLNRQTPTFGSELVFTLGRQALSQ